MTFNIEWVWLTTRRKMPRIRPSGMTTHAKHTRVAWWSKYTEYRWEWHCDAFHNSAVDMALWCQRGPLYGHRDTGVPGGVSTDPWGLAVRWGGVLPLSPMLRKKNNLIKSKVQGAFLSPGEARLPAVTPPGPPLTHTSTWPPLVPIMIILTDLTASRHRSQSTRANEPLNHVTRFRPILPGHYG